MTHHTGSIPDTPRAADWRDSAACRDEDAELFFPVGATPAANAQTRHAKVICSGCPVLQACGAWALATRQAFGVWGGMSERERTSILRQRGRGTGRKTAATEAHA
jgi:WhiB family transcriptional regulator, redox-sensing transcriptional regulator